jgi:hypothetical protein
MDNIEMAQEGMEHAHHHEAHGVDPWTKRAAMLIAALAAAAVVGEMSANDAQTQYIAAHISASDTWNQYQAKSIRRSIFLQSAVALTAAHADPAEIAAARNDAARMQSEPGHDGMTQLAAIAEEHEHRRDHELHRHEHLERGVRGLQIAIVLGSLFVVTRLRWLLAIGAGLGIVSAVYALAVGIG